MKLPFWTWCSLALGLVAFTCQASGNDRVVELGQDTYSVTRVAKTGFGNDTDKLQELALKDAQEYCAKLHKEIKVLSKTSYRPKWMLTGYANAKVTFKALDANDPELHTPVPDPVEPNATGASGQPTATGSLYADLMKLDDLRKRGILTEEEFQAQKKKLLEKSN